MSRLWIDCTRTIDSGLHTGIQRMVRRLLQHAHANAAKARVAPVRWCQLSQSWRAVTTLQAHPQDLFETTLHWPQATPQKGDSLLLPDALWHIDAITPLLNAHQMGLHLHGICHDVLPATEPQWFPPTLAQPFKSYWQCLLEFAESITCVSAHTQQRLAQWAKTQQWSLPHSCVIYPGIDAAMPMLSTDHELSLTNDLPIFLQVGTVEPRKGHAVIVDAFEQLWRQGHSLHWLVIGQAGWANSSLQQRLLDLHNGPEPMTWLQQASDVNLHALYARATVLLAAAADEGYGLPVSEAAIAGLPLLLNDTVIYREVHARTPEAAVRWVRQASDWPQALLSTLEQPLSRLAGRLSQREQQSIHTNSDLGWSTAAQAFIMTALLPRQ